MKESEKRNGIDSALDTDDSNLRPDDAPGTPRWVKLFGIIALVLVLLFVILHLTGGGFRGHDLHSVGMEHGVTQP